MTRRAQRRPPSHTNSPDAPASTTSTPKAFLKKCPSSTLTGTSSEADAGTSTSDTAVVCAGAAFVDVTCVEGASSC
ncbi:hypothetical protein PLICRDRAFT_488607 [Plicaturopsis crispa FD-325 SS-3]|nr:hypothetical protein PLICRDRAFT_488607 [Plicaturopsis crispa FD-325 SS-3]